MQSPLPREVVQCVNLQPRLGGVFYWGKMAIVEQELVTVNRWQPQSYQDRFDIPVVVDPRVDLAQRLKDLGIRESIPSDRFTHTLILNTRYVIWIPKAPRHPGESLEEVKAGIEPNEEVVLNLRELAEVYSVLPSFFAMRALVAGASTLGKGFADISTLAQQPELFVVRANFKNARYEVLTRGRQVLPLDFP